ncbi:xanthine dehydrogenase accessory protein XdhC [Pelomonas sp. SE-A7]|uniref:xanthine dehydrogenase accessory protein XdhC n=1 Tax=Pelomonas sp. SE-A7 TaxID=3054953 RepID=UPI00259D28E8|nr:xanthine dehydrogenase accessory protein XdhC [Pelomonas sp. SE-A7]MDM4766203.1 xanthine dehydrogenase accessory protein XdhC [Pelomonas sp. SE-A7]
MRDWQQLALTLAREAVVLVTVHEVQGSGPREVGAWMAVTAAGLCAGTVGGGRLEFDGIAQARALLALGRIDEPVKRYPLGPSLGQCCGGVVWLRYELLSADQIPALRERLAPAPLGSVALFGGGHVGRAIVELLARLPLDLLWVDSRDEIFPADLPEQVRAEHSDPVQRAVADLAPGSLVLIMSFNHAEDLELVAACLARQRQRGDLPFIGLIGSKSKWASFRQRLEARGFTAAELAQVTSPIGLPGIAGKQPEVIAVAVAAQLLQRLDAAVE